MANESRSSYKVVYIVLTILLIVVLVYNLNSNQNKKTGLRITHPLLSIGRDDENALTKIDFEFYVYNGTANRVVVHSVKPVMDVQISSIITGVDRIEADNVVLESETGENIKGTIYFEDDGSKMKWLNELEGEGLIHSYVIEADVLLNRLGY